MQKAAKFKFTSLVLASVLLTLSQGGQAQTSADNLLVNPSSPDTSSSWTVTSPYDLFTTPPATGYQYSQYVPTSDLYSYDITFTLGTLSGGPDFALFWDYNLVQNTPQEITASNGSEYFDFTETAQGSSTDFGLVGNAAFWSSLENLDVYWNGGIIQRVTSQEASPSVPDSSVGFWLEASVLLGLCGVAGFYRQPQLAPSMVKAS